MPQLLPVRFVLRFYGRIAAAAFFATLWLIALQPLTFFPELPSRFLGQKPSNPPAGVQEILLPLDGEAPNHPTSNVIQVWKVSATTPRGTAILFRGNGGPLSYHLAIPRWLSARGYTTYIMNYPGYEKSSGFPTEALIAKESLQLYRYIAHVDREPTLVVGFSIGTPIAAHLASRTNPQCLVLVAPLASALDAAVDQPNLGPFFELVSGLLLYSFDSAAAVSHLRTTNLLIEAAERDTVLPVRHARKIADSYRGIWKGEVYSQTADHNTVFAEETARFEPLFERCVGLR